MFLLLERVGNVLFIWCHVGTMPVHPTTSGVTCRTKAWHLTAEDTFFILFVPDEQGKYKEISSIFKMIYFSEIACRSRKWSMNLPHMWGMTWTSTTSITSTFLLDSHPSGAPSGAANDEASPELSSKWVKSHRREASGTLWNPLSILCGPVRWSVFQSWALRILAQKFTIFDMWPQGLKELWTWSVRWLA